LRGCRVIAIKQCVDLYPEADAVYGCDKPWWEFRRGLPEFRGLKVTWRGNGLAGFEDIRRIDIAEMPKPSAEKYASDIRMEPVGTIGGGGNSGFQAMNLALQWGARQIVLIGFDMSDRGGVHWYGRNHWPAANNPSDSNFKRWIAAFNGSVPVLDRIGARVINASPNSALACYPKMSLEKALAEFA
jgi:hypothetical protein